MNIKLLIEELYRKHSIKPLLTIGVPTRLEPLSQVLKPKTPTRKPSKELQINKRHASLIRGSEEILHLKSINSNGFPIRNNLPSIKYKKKQRIGALNEAENTLPASLRPKYYSKNASPDLSIEKTIEIANYSELPNADLKQVLTPIYETDIKKRINKLPTISKHDSIDIDKEELIQYKGKKPKKIRISECHINTRTVEKHTPVSSKYQSIDYDDLAPW